ncbi:MAG: Shedu immune nuclease family protein [Bacillota bacterium]
MIIKSFNPSVSKFYTFTVQEDKDSLISYYRIEVEEAAGFFYIDEAVKTNSDLNSLIDEAEFLNQAEAILENSQKYAFFSNKDEIHYTLHNISEISGDVIFEGYTKFPKGFYTVGGGISNNFSKRAIIDGIKSYVGSSKGKISLKISKTNPTKVSKVGQTTSICISDQDWNHIWSVTNAGKNHGTIIASDAIAVLLTEKSPKLSKYKSSQENIGLRKSLLLASLSKDIAESFNAEEKSKLEDFFYSVLIKSSSELVTRNVFKAREISIDQLISKFDELMKKCPSETTWQRFFEANIMLFDSRYIGFLPKTNISVGKTSYPDFLVYDIYGFVDIYEIKKSDAKLLKEDVSHNSYFWSPDASSAICQLEKYIFQVSEARLQIETQLAEKIEKRISLVRPKGVLVMGSHEEFVGKQQMQQAFAYLRRSLKNIEIVLFDELLNNLKNLKDQQVK